MLTRRTALTVAGLTLATLLIALAVGGLWFLYGYAPVSDEPVRDAVVRGPESSPYELSFIQFAEDGSFRDPRQLRKSLDLLDTAQDTGAIVVVFIHGWNNNCGECSQSVKCFEQMLAFISSLQQNVFHGSAGKLQAPRKVFGIFLGWHGLIARPPLYNDLVTFNNRRSVADRLGSAGALREVLEKLSAKRTALSAKKKSVLLVAGHSLGGRALFRAITGGAAQPVARLSASSDLFVLLNPAFSASDYLEVDRAASTAGAAKVPRTVILASESDYVTQYAYPFSENRRWLLQIDDEEKRGRFLTVGNFSPYITHRLLATNGLPASRQLPAPGEAPCECTSVKSTDLSPLLEQRTDIYNFTSFRIQGGADGNPYTVELAPSGIQRGPFWVVQVDRRLMNGHGNIYAPAVTEFLIRLSNQVFRANLSP